MQKPDASSQLALVAGQLLDRLRTRAPRVHCITNGVAQNFTANVLLSVGAVPSMTLSAEEIGDFVGSAQALLVNLGTFDAERRQATLIAVQEAVRRALPWVLDPVFVDRSPGRLAFARDLVARGPRVVRLNRGEFEALAGESANEAAVARYAEAGRMVVALSGAFDLVAGGAHTFTIANGHPLMAKVTAMGCAGSAMVAAFLAVEPDAPTATAAAMLALGVAGEQAARQARGPGSFAVAILDALSLLDTATLTSQARLS